MKEKASHGLTTVTVDGTSVSSYDDLLALFKAAVAKTLQVLKQIIMAINLYLQAIRQNSKKLSIRNSYKRQTVSQVLFSNNR